MASYTPIQPSLSVGSGSLHAASPSPVSAQPWSPGQSQATSTSLGLATIMTMPSKSDVPKISSWTYKEVTLFEIWCRSHQLYSVLCKDAWTIITQLFPADVVSLLDALVSGHRGKLGYPRDDVTSLTISHVIQCLRDSASKDVATLEYNKKITSTAILSTGRETAFRILGTTG